MLKRAQARGDMGVGPMMWLYGATVFGSALLLFLVQPVIAKQILPWFGGSAAVWTTSLVFFQAALLAGYVYVAACIRFLTPRRQAIVHTGLLLASLASLPIALAAHWKPDGSANPSLRILELLAVSIGMPYFLLATTSPLAQTWLARARPHVNPYRLFALSNLASMLALLGYPLLLEPRSATHQQAAGWSVAYAVFATLCITAAWASVRYAPSTGASVASRNAADVSPGKAPEQRPTAARMLLWCTLAATSSILLLSVTNQITRNIAAVPLLWIVPLVIYLLSFVLVFDRPGWYRRGLVLPLAGAGVVAMALPLDYLGSAHDLVFEIGVFLAGLFAVCLFAHGELALLKPAPRYLTTFYLMLALGGALGSALVGIAAPLLTRAYLELPVGLALCSVLLYWQIRGQAAGYRALAVAVILATVFCATLSIRFFFSNTINVTRNFYGVLRVMELPGDATGPYRTLNDGTTLHGAQLLSGPSRREPTAYYTRSSGIGRLLTVLDRNRAPLHIGVIGLGIGTLAAYARAGDLYRFYEINPAVARLANVDFTFLRDSPATIQIVLGDARLSLEREPPQGFDVLAIDAFSSDAIPVHLLTREALALYRRHLRVGGVIAFHISNRFLDLAPVVEALAADQQLQAISVVDRGLTGLRPMPNVWMLLAQTPGTLDAAELVRAAQPATLHHDGPLWSDDYNNLLQVLR
jgi:hypothetical protein